MKKILLVSLMILLAVSVAFSQVGIRGGMNLGTIGGDDKTQNGIDPTTKVGFTGGITYHIGLLFGLSIEPEVLYIQQGAIYEGSASYGGYSLSQKATFSSDYIDIPVLARFNFPMLVLSPYIEGGVAYSILLSAKSKVETTTNIPGQTSGSTETDIKDHLSKSDVSLIVGVGVEFFMVEINARYILGMSKLDKDGLYKAYNRGIMLTAGLRF
jgi:opacity protein-like surface antigen